MAAEVVRHFFPKLVDLHNYVPASSTQQKLSNWSVLNRQDSTGFSRAASESDEGGCTQGPEPEENSVHS